MKSLNKRALKKWQGSNRNKSEERNYSKKMKKIAT